MAADAFRVPQQHTPGNVFDRCGSVSWRHRPSAGMPDEELPERSVSACASAAQQSPDRGRSVTLRHAGRAHAAVNRPPLQRNRLRPSQRDLDRMLDGLRSSARSPTSAPALQQICDCGARLGLRMLRDTAPKDALATFSSEALRQLQRQLRARLIRITFRCYRLQWDAFVSATRALRTLRRGDAGR
jgi:hypothetical protein